MNTLNEISKITNRLYLSGVFPLETEEIIDNGIENSNIQYVVCCVKSSNVIEEHLNIMQLIPNICIIYLPFDDIVTENLWKINHGEVSILIPNFSIKKKDKIKSMLNIYIGKSYIEIAYHFIEFAMESKSNILIHCMAGISRSVSVLCYFLMKKNNISYRNAIDFVKKYRPIASPNKSFVKQLLAYDKLRDKYRSADSEMICNSFLIKK